MLLHCRAPAAVVPRAAASSALQRGAVQRREQRAPTPPAAAVSRLHQLQGPLLQAPWALSATADGASSSIDDSTDSRPASSDIPQQRQRRGRPRNAMAMPATIEAEQLLHALGLSSAASAKASRSNQLRNLLKGLENQGVLQHRAAVMQHLRGLVEGLGEQQTEQLLEQLLEGCPSLFSWPPEERAALLFGQLMAAGLTFEEAARCFIAHPQAADRCSFAAGIAELTAILAHSWDKENTPGPKPQMPAAERAVATLLRRFPDAVRLVAHTAGYLRQHSAKLRQAGHPDGDVAYLAWRQLQKRWRDHENKADGLQTVLEGVFGLSPEEADKAVGSASPLITSNMDELEYRARALVEGFGKARAAAMAVQSADMLCCGAGVWQRNLHYMAACGVRDPKAMLERYPSLLLVDHAAAGFVERRLLLQRYFGLTATQLYEGHPRCFAFMKPPKLAQRIQFVQHCGEAHRLVAKAGTGWRAAGAEPRPLGMNFVLHSPQPKFLAAVGAMLEDWEAFDAAYPPSECAVFRWAQREAQQEAQRLRAVLPPDLQY